MKNRECHKCEHNGKGSNACLECIYEEPKHYSIQFNPSLEKASSLDADDQKASQLSQGSTKQRIEENAIENLDDDLHQLFKERIIELFDLEPIQLLMLQSILKGNTLVEFARGIQKMSSSSLTFSRQRAFQVRKSLAQKVVWLKQALITNGQRKHLK